jgi:hypothetical protein
MPENYTDDTAPMQQMKSLPFIIDPEIETDCMKTSELEYKWEVFQYGKESSGPVLVQKDDEQFMFHVRMLSYGVYVLNYTISMQGIENTTRSDMGYLEIIKSPLIIKQSGDIIENVTYGEPYVLNAANITIDPDVEEWDKSGFIFTWFCTQVKTFFSLDGIDWESIDETMMEVLNYPTGCFGVPPGGRANVTGGAWTLDTSYLLPFSVYILTINITKDTRRGYTDVQIYIPPLDPPVIIIR